MEGAGVGEIEEAVGAGAEEVEGGVCFAVETAGEREVLPEVIAGGAAALRFDGDLVAQAALVGADDEDIVTDGGAAAVEAGQAEDVDFGERGDGGRQLVLLKGVEADFGFEVGRPLAEEVGGEGPFFAALGGEIGGVGGGGAAGEGEAVEGGGGVAAELGGR